MGKPKVVAIIQARMSSTRLPGKVLQLIAGKPILWHIIHRLRKCRTIDAIAIATSNQPSDDPLVLFARDECVELVRGSEDNVLQRFAQAANQLNPDVIIRVTGDAPLIDPETIDLLVETLINENAEYCTGKKGVPSINEGFCPFSRTALNRLLVEAAHDPVAIEHVTAYFKEHPESFRIAYVDIPVEYQFAGAHTSVDTPADLNFIETLYLALGSYPGDAEITDVVKLLKNCPELLEINRHVYQKKATDRTFRIVVRCDGDSVIGLGHVVRCLALADELREKHGCGITFAMASGDVGMALVREKGFPISAKPKDENEAKWLDGLIGKRPDALILDIRNDLSREKIRDWREKGILMVTIDDPSERRLEADLAFYPPVPQVQFLNWDNFTGERFVGWEWVVLRRAFGNKPSENDKLPMQLLVMMGGSDPVGLTLRVVRILDNLDGDFETTVITGSGFNQNVELELLGTQTKRRFQVLHNIENIEHYMANSNLAIASFGMTAYELAAMGVPTIYLCLTSDHAKSASLFVEQGLGVSCGVHTQVSDEEICSSIEQLLKSKSKLKEMSLKALETVDGYGTNRIAKKIIQRSLAK